MDFVPTSQDSSGRVFLFVSDVSSGRTQDPTLAHDASRTPPPLGPVSRYLETREGVIPKTTHGRSPYRLSRWELT